MVQFCYLRLHLGIQTVTCRLLQRMARMDMDWRLEKAGPVFQALMLRLEKSRKYHCG